MPPATRKRTPRYSGRAAAILLAFAWHAAGVAPQNFAGVPLAVLGDSISQGVQSADAGVRSQRGTYAALLAAQAGVPLPLPLIASSPVGVVNSTVGRRRLFPRRPCFNLAVSGADAFALRFALAGDVGLPGIGPETALVLAPYRGSQLEVVERLAPARIICWIGNNDVLSAVLAYDRYDASQMTPVELFRQDFADIAARLHATGAEVVFGNIADVMDIGFLADADDVFRLSGHDVAARLPEGHYTSMIAVLLLRLGVADGSLLEDPAYVLDAFEMALIRERIQALNAIIAAEAAAAGFALVDVHGLMESMRASPPAPAGTPLSTRFLGGLLSLDGVHPSDTAHALLANAFIDAMNTRYGAGIPPLSPGDLRRIALRDPHIDRNGNGRVPGRPGAGLLETLAPLLGVSADRSDRRTPPPPLPDPDAAPRLLAAYRSLTGSTAGTVGTAEPAERATVEAVLRHMFMGTP